MIQTYLLRIIVSNHTYWRNVFVFATSLIYRWSKFWKDSLVWHNKFIRSNFVQSLDRWSIIFISSFQTIEISTHNRQGRINSSF